MQFREDRSVLKSALFYCRIDVPVWKRIINAIIIVVAIVWLNELWLPVADALFYSTYQYLFLVAIGAMFEGHYFKFINGLRSFEDGLRLPGRKSELIEWSAIKAMEAGDEVVEITFEDGKKKVGIDRRDLTDLDEIVKLWQSKTHQKRENESISPS